MHMSTAIKAKCKWKWWQNYCWTRKWALLMTVLCFLFFLTSRLIITRITRSHKRTIQHIRCSKIRYSTNEPIHMVWTLMIFIKIIRLFIVCVFALSILLLLWFFCWFSLTNRQYDAMLMKNLQNDHTISCWNWKFAFESHNET